MSLLPEVNLAHAFNQTPEMAITTDERTRLVRICLHATCDRDTVENLARETLQEALRYWHTLRGSHARISRPPRMVPSCGMNMHKPRMGNVLSSPMPNTCRVCRSPW